MAFVVTKTSDHGTKNPIVARLSVQSRQLMDAFSLTKEKKKGIWSILHDKVQNQILACYDTWNEIAVREVQIVKKVEEEGIETQSHGRVATIDTIERLEQSAHAFLYSAKSALRDAKSMICEFFVENRRKRRELEDGNYGKLKDWAEGRFGGSDPITALIAEDLNLWIDEVFSKRNAVDHPGGSSGILRVSNFSAVQDPETKNWKGVLPTWARNQDQPSSITRDMLITIENTLCFSEDILVQCLLKSGSMVPVVFYEISEEDRDPDCPIRLCVTIDREKLESQHGTGADG